MTSTLQPPTSADPQQQPCQTSLIYELVAKDLKAARWEYLFAPPQFLRKHLIALLEDPRDAPVLYAVLNMLLLAVPAAVCLHLYCHSHLLGVLYLAANYALFLQRFMLTLHFSEHRRLFKQEYGWLNHIVPYLLCTLYGVPGGLYKLHHCIMHHVEDNHSPHDLSSTEPYQRDNFLPFLRYWLRFAVGTWFELPLYALSKQRYQWAAGVLSAESCYWLALSLLWQHNPVATLWSLLIPFGISTFALMLGNWSQHVFVDPDRPDSAYRSTYNCLACPDNCVTYNDGYHIIHHLNSRLHWSQLPQQFLVTLQQHDEQDALVFKGIGFFDVGVSVFTGRLDWLAQRIVPCGPKQAARSHEDWVKLLRHRLKPVRRPKQQ